MPSGKWLLLLLSRSRTLSIVLAQRNTTFASNSMLSIDCASITRTPRAFPFLAS